MLLQLILESRTNGTEEPQPLRAPSDLIESDCRSIIHLCRRLAASWRGVVAFDSPGLAARHRVAEVCSLHGLLAISKDLFKQAVAMGDEQAMITVAQERSVACSYIAQATCWHRLPPMALGSGRASLDYKLRALCKSLYLETQSMPALKGVLSMVCGFCTDLGTEAGLADTAGLSVAEVLSGDVRDSAEDDLQVDGVAACGEAQKDNDSECATDHLFPNALWVPGVGHIMHNLTNAVDKALPNWEPWFRKFKAVNALLLRKALRKTFDSHVPLGNPSCVDGSIPRERNQEGR